MNKDAIKIVNQLTSHDAADQVMIATRQAMAEWRDNHSVDEFDNMRARLDYINKRVIELTTETAREAAEFY